VLWFADQACFVLHTVLIVFNAAGWAWRRTRRLHLVTLGATAFSWFVLGAWHGWGYCLFADLHFEIRERRGLVDPEHSYVQLLARHWFGVPLDLPTANLLAGTVFALIVLATITAWTRDGKVSTPGRRDPAKSAE
jgi:hypothetical protein